MKNIWFGITVLVLVVVAVVYFNKNFVQPTGSFLNPVKLPAETTKINDGKIILVKKINGDTEIQSIDNAGKSHVLFTDKDDKDKITEIGALNPAKNTVSLILGKSTLVEIKSDGTEGETVLSKEFSFPDFSLSPDGKQITYISFSNVEKDYGFSIKISDFKGSTQEIYRSDNELSNLSWLAEGIAFVEDADSATAKMIDLKGQKTTLIYTTKNNLIDINFKDNLTTEGNIEKSTSKLGIISAEKAKIIYEDNNNLISSPVKSNTGEKIAFLALGDSLDENGNLYVIDKTGKNIKKIGQAIKILGWVN